MPVTLPRLSDLSPFFLVLALTACGTAAIDRAAQLPPPTTTAPSVTGEDRARADLYPLAMAAPLSAEPWLWWSGDVPADAQGQRWAEFNDWRADMQADHGGVTRGPEWDAFERGLKAAFPLELMVYELPGQACGGDCGEKTYIIEGRAAWGVGGFISTVQDGR